MCGRYTPATPLGGVVAEFGFGGPLPGLRPSYNVAPMQKVAAVVENDGGRWLEMSRWGLILVWADDPGIGARTINARSEKSSFEKAFKQRRYLVNGGLL